MVGALADWFAVTALFRHPLGLPIPHTAIIPKRKEALGHSLSEFVSENFLVSSIVRARVESSGLARRIGAWLAEPAHARRVVAEAGTAVRYGLTIMDDTDVVALTQQVLIPRLEEEPLAPAAGHLLERIVADGAHRPMVDLVVSEAHRWLAANREAVAEALASRAPWWTPRWVDDRMTNRLHRELLTWLDQMRSDPEHPTRLAIDNALATLAHDLLEDADVQAKAEGLKARLLHHEQVPETVRRLWNALRTAMVDALGDEDSLLHRRGERAVVDFGTALATDVSLQKRIDGYAADAVSYVVDNYGTEVASVISDKIGRAHV